MSGYAADRMLFRILAAVGPVVLSGADVRAPSGDLGHTYTIELIAAAVIVAVLLL